jgi:hypothetical protein
MMAIVARALKAPGTRHACLRLKANAARQSLGLDTLPAVVKRCFPGVKLTEHAQDGFFTLPNESEIWISGLDDKDRIEKILGKEFITIFLNEASQIPYSSFLVAMTRLAQVHPAIKQRCFVDLNPTGKKHWTNMLFGLGLDPISEQPIRNREAYGRAFLNPVDNAHNLSEEFIQSLTDMPEKQRKRFFEGLYQDEVEGALWNYEMIEKLRVPDSEIPPGMRQRVVIAVDPSGAKSSEDLASDEIGICVVAKGTNGHGYILADLSMRGSPQEWALRVVTAYEQYQADAIIAEANFGGAMVEAVIKAINPNVNVKMVTASRGKVIRAEPIAALYERGRVHHVGTFRKLEDQMCAFSTAGYQGGDSPDHCLVAGTLVATDKGEVPIECVKAGDLVLTRKGYREVLWSGMTQENAVVTTLHFSGGALTATAPHPIFDASVGAFTPLHRLNSGSKLEAKGYYEWLYMKRTPRSRSCSRVKCTGETQKALKQTGHSPQLVHVPVERKVEEKQKQPVYNIKVKGEPEFFANGVLVHNCDAMIWGCTELLSAPDGGAIIEFYKNQLEKQAPEKASRDL